MSEDKVIGLKNPGTPAPVSDALTDILREGAQRMLGAVIEAEVSVFLEGFMRQATAGGPATTGAQRVICLGGRYRPVWGLWK